MLFRSFHFSRDGLASRGLLLLLAACFSAGPAAAQSEAGFLHKTVRLIVTLAPGGGVDVQARLLAKGLHGVWGQPVIVENRVGGDGIIGSEIVVRAPPDGTTLLMVTAGPITVLPFLHEKMSYNPLVDLTPIAMTVFTPNILVVPVQSPHKTFKDLMAAAKARPGALDYASAGRGGGSHMNMESMMKATGTRFTEIPYKGAAPAVLAVLAGEVQAAWISVSTALPFIQSGKLLGLAVSSKARVPLAPDIPTVAEQGFPGFEFSIWMGVFGPAKMPAALIKKIEADIQTVVSSPSYREEIGKQGNIPRYESAEQFSKTIREEYAHNKATLTLSR